MIILLEYFGNKYVKKLIIEFTNKDIIIPASIIELLFIYLSIVFDIAKIIIIVIKANAIAEDIYKI